MRKKILMVSPYPSHPPNAGSNVRIVQLASALKNMGHEVHFLFSQQFDDGDEEEMDDFWGGLAYGIPPEPPFPRRGLKKKIVEALRNLSKLELHCLDQVYYDIDDWYEPLMDAYLVELTNRHFFDVVIVEYVFLSSAFKHFSDDTLKIVDTHDIFTNRHRNFLELNSDEAYSWFTATAAGEKHGLDRADLVIAIQQEEEQHFKLITERAVVTIGHIIQPNLPLQETGHQQELLYVGARTPDNRQGLEFFAKEVMPKVLESYPATKLLLVGNICDEVSVFPGCEKLGLVDDLDSVYKRATVVINPALSGTGLAIKSVEALHYAKPLVAMPAGARGLKEWSDKALLMAHDASEFASHVVQLFDDDELRELFSQQAYEFSKRYRKGNMDRLSTVISGDFLNI